MEFTISGNIADVLNRRIFPGSIFISGGKIISVEPNHEVYENFILPGFVDAHIHIESSMLTPYEFARVALGHGTLATVSDPHEIANVCGMEGVHYMIENAKDARLKFHFGAPSCVPATAFETAGAVINPDGVEELLQRNDIYYLSEMMNYPGVLSGDAEVMKKIALAKKYGKPVDGHAPGLKGIDAEKYIKAGISTDHECFTKDEALGKLKHGMKIIIREGSAAKNFEALHSLLSEFPDQVMLCSDDKHPDDLLEGHINELVKRALAKGHQLMDVLQAACVNPVLHYRLPVGLLRVNDPADFIMVRNLEDFHIDATYVNGEKVASAGNCVLSPRRHKIINSFSASEKTTADFHVPAAGSTIRIIKALDGQLITGQYTGKALIRQNNVVSDVQNDVLKLAVVNRYYDSPAAIAFINQFELAKGAIASTVAHDSHNIIAVGTSDEDICRVVNLLIRNKGGLALVSDDDEMVLPLPVAGLMSDQDCMTAGRQYAALTAKAKEMGCRLAAPFMTLSFMALLVIPDLKLSDKGLFEGSTFKFVSLFEK
jgi:adenine deaminase